ncbi:hypothetical protein ACJJTC_014993 [Scirpophaga incertulas]
MAQRDADKRMSRDPWISRDPRNPQDRSRDRREAEHDRLRLAAMGIEGGGELPARLTPAQPNIRILSNVQLQPPTAERTTESPTGPDEESHQRTSGAQLTAPKTAPARLAGDAREAAPRGRDRDRPHAPRGSIDADRGSRDRADRPLSRGSDSAPHGGADADRGSRDRAKSPPSRDEENAPLGSVSLDTKTRRKIDGKIPQTTPSSDNKREPKKAATTDTHIEKSKITPPSPGRRARIIIESRRPTFKKTNNPSLIKRTPEKKTVQPPSSQRPGAPQNSPTTPAKPISTSRPDETSHTTRLQPKPQRLPRKLDVNVSSDAASRDSSVASMDSGPKDVKNRVQKSKSPASHPPAFGSSTSGTRGRKRAQEDEPEPEFKQPATMLKYSSQTTPPKPSTSYAQVTSVGEILTTTHHTTEKDEEMDTVEYKNRSRPSTPQPEAKKDQPKYPPIVVERLERWPAHFKKLQELIGAAATTTNTTTTKARGSRRGKKARKPKTQAQQPINIATQQPEMYQIEASQIKSTVSEAQGAAIPAPTATRPEGRRREQPSTSTSVEASTSVPTLGTANAKTKLPKVKVVAALSGTKAKPEAAKAEDEAPNDTIGIIIDGLCKLFTELKRAWRAGENLIPVVEGCLPTTVSNTMAEVEMLGLDAKTGENVKVTFPTSLDTLTSPIPRISSL